MDSLISSLKHHQKIPSTAAVKSSNEPLPKFEFFLSNGFTSSDIATVLTRIPHILKRNLENHIIPSFVFLKSLLGTNENTIIALTRFWSIPVVKLDTCVIPNVNLLREIGVPESIICGFIKKWTRAITTDTVRFKEIVEGVKEMGFNPLRLSFVQAVLAYSGMNKSTWERKVNAYKRWGLSEEEILVAFGKSPQCITVSEDKIMRVMDFLVNGMGVEASLIVKCPTLISLSLEKRLIPRASVIQVLQLKEIDELFGGNFLAIEAIKGNRIFQAKQAISKRELGYRHAAAVNIYVMDSKCCVIFIVLLNPIVLELALVHVQEWN
uniref:Uncharacterized protein n=1 Tax=Quercus lobata TaxID=97700 RepID=A0A7N2LUQ7_QUELO